MKNSLTKRAHTAGRKGKKISDQSAKIEAISLSRGWTKNIHWEVELDIKSSTLSNWRKGSPISIENLAKICKQADLTPNDFDLPLPQFCKKLGIRDISHQLARQQDYPYFAHRKLAPHDQVILDTLPGRYHGLYIRWEAKQKDYASLCSETFEIYPRVADHPYCLFEHRNNHTQNEPVFGQISITNERVFGFITYKTYYPPSSYLMISYPRSTEQPTLYGVYTDIEPMPNKEIFSLPFLLLPEVKGMPDFTELPILKGTKLFDVFQELLLDENVLSPKKRLMIGTTINIKDKIKKMWEILGAPIEEIS